MKTNNRPRRSRQLRSKRRRAQLRLEQRIAGKSKDSDGVRHPNIILVSEYRNGMLHLVRQIADRMKRQDMAA